MKKQTTTPKITGRKTFRTADGSKWYAWPASNKSKRRAAIENAPLVTIENGKTRVISEGTAAKPAEKESASLSASQARRLIRDLEYFVKTGELSEAEYKAQRASIVARMTQGERK